MSATGEALQQIGMGMMNRGFAKRDNAAAEEKRRQQQIEDEKLWRDRQAYMARLQAPPERVRALYDEQLGKAVSVRESWQPGNETEPGRWAETGRDVIPPKDSAPQVVKFRQGDEEITSIIDPNDPASAKELGRGNAFAPSARGGRRAGADADGDAMGSIGGKKSKGAPSGYQWTEDGQLEPITGGPADKKSAAPPALNSADKKQVITAKQKLAALDAIENQLNNVEANFKPLKGTWAAGGFGQGALPFEDGKKLDASIAQLAPLMRQLTRVPGEGAQSDYEARLAQLALMDRGDYEGTTEQKIEEARELVKGIREGNRMTLEVYGIGEEPKAEGAAKPQGASRESPMPINSEAEADRLPPGTWVIMNGRIGQT